MTVTIYRGSFSPIAGTSTVTYTATCEDDCIDAMDLAVYRHCVQHNAEIALANRGRSGFTQGTPQSVIDARANGGW